MYRMAVTNRHLCEEDFLVRIRCLAEDEKYDAIVLREKDLPEEQYRELAEEVLKICGEYKKKCILHFFYDVALQLHHPYLQIPLSRWSGLPQKKREELREQVEEIGTSVHSQEQLAQATGMGAAYVVAGHVFPTECKRGKEPKGIEFIRDICRESAVPVYAIGGIREENEQSVVDAGAAGVCCMSGCMRQNTGQNGAYNRS